MILNTLKPEYRVRKDGIGMAGEDDALVGIIQQKALEGSNQDP